MGLLTVTGAQSVNTKEVYSIIRHGRVAVDKTTLARLFQASLGGEKPAFRVVKFYCSFQYFTLLDLLSAISPLVEGFRLCQNYPNPFNPSTKINYQVPTRSHVTITIYDLLGRAVEVLVDAEKEPGNYSAVWNAKAFQSGVYFCKMQSERYTDMKKLALIK